jgi:Fungal specific transcription factor domain
MLLATHATPNHSLTWPLCQTVNAMAPQHVLSSAKSVYYVQAYLLLATWPQTFPPGASIQDQGWMYVGVATHMAQCLGLHRSFMSSEYSSVRSEPTEDTRREWVRTWVGCFIVSQLYTLTPHPLTQFIHDVGSESHHLGGLYYPKRSCAIIPHHLLNLRPHAHEPPRQAQNGPSRSTNNRSLVIVSKNLHWAIRNRRQPRYLPCPH